MNGVPKIGGEHSVGKQRSADHGGRQMNIPAFLQPLHPLPPIAGASPTADVTSVAGVPESASLAGFFVQAQLQSNWCWAAVSASMAAFFGSSNWTQCKVAAAELGPLQCCGADASSKCNQPWYLDAALARTGHFDHMNASNSHFADVRTEINNGRPLGCRIAWSGGGAHFMTLSGWRVTADGSEYVDVHDPYYGFAQKSYPDFVAAYQSSGDAWTHTYFARSSVQVGAGGTAPGAHSPLSA